MGAGSSVANPNPNTQVLLFDGLEDDHVTEGKAKTLTGKSYDSQLWEGEGIFGPFAYMTPSLATLLPISLSPLRAVAFWVLAATV